MQIFRNLKPYWKSVIIIALLLVLQAYCDLSLPDYTSKLIDTGIQNYGIENCSPKQIPEKAYKVIDGFMDDDEKAVWKKYYKDGSDGYYYLTEDGEKHIDEVDSACMKGLMMYYYPYQMVNSDEDNEIKAGLDKMGITLDEMPEEMWAQIGEQMKPTVDGMLDSMGEDYMESTAIACTRICYDSFGYDYKAGQMSYLKWAAVKMLGMSLLMAAAAVLIGLVASRVAASVACGLREKVFNKVIAFSDAEINKFSTASLITRSTNDVQQIQMVTVMMLRMVLYAPILSIGGIVKVVGNGAGMGWVIFIGIAAVVILMGTLMVIAMPKFKVMQTLVDRVNLVSREILTGIPVIRAFGREEREEERFDEANKDLTKNTLFVNRVMTFAMPILMFIMYAISILIEWVAAHKIDAGVLQVGSMTAFITYTMLIIMSFLMLSMMSVMLPRASVAADRIQEIIDAKICEVKISSTSSIQLHGKGNKIRIVPLMENTVKHFKNYMKEFHSGETWESQNYIFYANHHGVMEKICDDTIRVRMNIYAEMARQECSEVPERVHPHLWRHSRAMHLYQHGMDLTLISQWLGHKQFTTTLVYAHADTETKRKAIEKAIGGTSPIEQISQATYKVEDEETLKRLYGLK